MSEATPLIDVRQDQTFLEDKRDLASALIHARRFATDEPIKDRKEAGEVADAIKGLRLLIEAAKEHKLAKTAVWRASTGHVNTEYKELLANPEAAVEALKRKGAAFEQRERRRLAEERKREEVRLAKDAEEKAAAAQAAAEKLSEDPKDEAARQKAAAAHNAAARAAVATPPPATQPPKQMRGSFGTLGTRTDYRFEVIDKDAVPAEFLTVNERAVKAAVKGERDMAKAQERCFNLELIPGVRIWSEEVAVSR